MVVFDVAMLNVALILSLVGVGIHLLQEHRFLSDWAKTCPSTEMARNFTTKAVRISIIGLLVIYTLMIVFALWSNSDLARIVILAAQGSVLINWAMHATFKLVWKWQMPGFYTATFAMLPPTIFIIYYAFDQWWFSNILKTEVLFAGMILDLLVPYALMNVGRFLDEKRKLQASAWENFDT